MLIESTVMAVGFIAVLILFLWLGFSKRWPGRQDVLVMLFFPAWAFVMFLSLYIAGVIRALVGFAE